MSQNKMPPDRYSQMIKHLTRKKIKNPFIPASAIQRPKKVLEIEAFQDFNARNKLAGGGMLVQPSADGSRPGYAKDEKKAAYMREYYKKQVAPSRKMTEAGAQRVKRTKALDEYIKTLGKVVNTDDLYKKLEELGFEYDNINSKIDKLKRGKLKGKTFTKKTQKIQDPRMDKDRLKELDKYAKYLKGQGVEGMGDTYKTSTEKAQRSIYNRAANRNFKFTLDKEKKPKDTFTESQKNKIKAAFNISDADFDAAGTQYGVPSGNNVPGEEGKALKRRYALVKDFVNRGFKEGSQKLPSGLLRKEDQLPLDIQTEIKTKYELPEDYINKATGKREWDFTRHKYGVPGTKGNPLLRRLTRKIEYEFVTNPSTKKFKFVGDFKTPQGWIMAQMYRAGVEQGSPNYQPIYGKINDTIKIVGFTDNTVGGDFYVRDEFVQPGGKPMRLHPDFDDVKKFVDVANKANAPLEGTLKGMLKQIGVVDNRLTMTTLLNYLAREEGYNATNRALVLHHKGGVFENATRDLQLLRNINNSAIQGAENRIRSVVNLGQTPDKADIKILKDNRARVTVGGQTFGAGPQTPGGAFRSYEKFIAEQIKQGKIQKDPLLKFINTEFKKLNIPKGEAGFIKTELLQDIARVGGRGVRTVSKYGVLPEFLFAATDYLNERSKGKSKEEAKGIAINNATFGLYSDPQNKAYIQGLQKTAESMGIDSSAFNSAYQLNILNKDFEKFYTKGTEQIKNLKELGLNDQAKNAQINLDRYADEQNKKYMMLQNDISDRITGGSPLTMVQGRGKVTQEQFAKPFFDMQKVALEKLKREKQSVFPTIQRKVDPAEGSMGTGFYNILDQIGQGIKNIATGRVVPFGPERLRPQASQRQLLADELRNLSARDLQRFNLGRGLTYGQPLTDADIENLQFQQPGVFFSKGGIAGLSGGDKSGPPPERGPNPQGLLSLKNRVRNL